VLWRIETHRVSLNFIALTEYRGGASLRIGEPAEAHRQKDRGDPGKKSYGACSSARAVAHFDEALSVLDGSLLALLIRLVHRRLRDPPDPEESFARGSSLSPINDVAPVPPRVRLEPNLLIYRSCGSIGTGNA
jgi:hypothetical protein